MGRNQVQFPLDSEAEIVEVEIVQVVVEGVFNFLSNLKEAKEQESCEGCSWNGKPAKLTIDLELKKKESLLTWKSGELKCENPRAGRGGTAKVTCGDGLGTQMGEAYCKYVQGWIPCHEAW